MRNSSEAFKNKTSEMGAEVFGHWLPRFLVAGADYNDVKNIHDESHNWEQWPYLWKTFADKNVNLGQEAETKGNLITAANAFKRASLYYHYGQFMLFDRPELKVQLHQLSRDFYMRGLKYFKHPGEKIVIPFKGKSIYAYHRRVKDSGDRLVMMVPGADATKEEMTTFEDIFLERGLSTLTFDSPGQGETRHEIPYRKTDFDEGVRTVIDYVVNELQYSQLAIGGISLGGHLAPRIAACNPIMKAAFGIGGRYDYSNNEFNKASTLFHANLSWVFGVETIEEAEVVSNEIDLSDVIKNLKCPLMIIHGDQDKIVNVRHAKLIVDNSSSIEPHLVIIENGNHVCNNYPYIYRPMVGDWVCEKLK
jgi:2,6-dihydroxypseudooxynicotine hydrolase